MSVVVWNFGASSDAVRAVLVYRLMHTDLPESRRDVFERCLLDAAQPTA